MVGEKRVGRRVSDRPRTRSHEHRGKREGFVCVCVCVSVFVCCTGGEGKLGGREGLSLSRFHTQTVKKPK